MDIRLLFEDGKKITIRYTEAHQLNTVKNMLKSFNYKDTQDIPIVNISYDDFDKFYPLLQVLDDSDLDFKEKETKINVIIGDQINDMIKYYKISDFMDCRSITNILESAINKNILENIGDKHKHIVSLLKYCSDNETDIINRYVNEYDRDRDYINYFSEVDDHIFFRFFDDITDKIINLDIGKAVYTTNKQLHYMQQRGYTNGVIYFSTGIKKNMEKLELLDYRLHYHFFNKYYEKIFVIYNKNIAEYHIFCKDMMYSGCITNSEYFYKIGSSSDFDELEIRINYLKKIKFYHHDKHGLCRVLDNKNTKIAL